jgi:hypothetical protein
LIGGRNRARTCDPLIKSQRVIVSQVISPNLYWSLSPLYCK